jgi:hypothetical protein
LRFRAVAIALRAPDWRRLCDILRRSRAVAKGYSSKQGPSIAKEVEMAFTVRLPNSENPHLRGDAPVASRHATLIAARRALLRQQVIAGRQGFHSEAYIWDEEHDQFVAGVPEEAAGIGR